MELNIDISIETVIYATDFLGAFMKPTSLCFDFMYEFWYIARLFLHTNWNVGTRLQQVKGSRVWGYTYLYEPCSI